MASGANNAQDFVRQHLGYDFNNNAVLSEALDTSGTVVHDSNKRLALLGDAVATLVILKDWYGTGTSKGKPLVARALADAIN